MPAWRYRRCPSCGKVERAGRFRCLDVGARWGWGPVAERVCPNCGHQAETSAFQVVREKHPAEVEQ